MTSRLKTVLAAVGASGALVAGGLAFGGSPAAADPIVPATYNCNTPLGAETVTLAFDAGALPPIPATWAAGVTLPATVTPTLTLPAELTTAIVTYLQKDSIGGTVAATLGNSGVPINFTVPTTPISAGQSVDIPTPGKVGAPTKVGNQTLTLPTSLNANLGGFQIPCTLTSTVVPVGTINIVGNTSSTTAKAVKATVKAATKGKAKGLGVAKVVATVKNGSFVTPAGTFPGDPGAGKVVAKQGAKTLATGTLKGGKATLTLKKLKVGKHKIVVSYVGANGVKGSSAKPIVIKVTK